MFKKLSSIKHATALLAGISCLGGLICSWALGCTWWQVLATTVGDFLATWIFAYYLVRGYIVYKIQPIYKMVFADELSTSQLHIQFATDPNITDTLSEDLSSLVEKNRKEIDRLNEVEKYRKEYIGNIAHEIKTPIFNIQGYILTLLDGGLEDPEINRRYLERAEKSIDRMINIVNDLDEISKIEAGMLSLNKVTFDVYAMCREVADTLEMEAARRRIALNIVPPPAGTTTLVKGDVHYISQVVVNLLSNTIRYGREGGRTRVSFLDLFDKVVIEVTDDGIGIALADIPRLFERFYRSDKSRSREQGGTGLGLAIVKLILEAHHEKITVRSKIDVGTTFSFTLQKA